VSTLYSLIQYSAGILSQSKKARERKKRNTNRKLLLFVDNVILYSKDPEESSRKLLYLINISSKVKEHKTIKHLLVFYT
jgi:hypothetical protein